MTGIELIAAERDRQVAIEGCTPEHDDLHTGAEMAYAAACYAEQAAGRNWLYYNPAFMGIPENEGAQRYQDDEVPDNWPEDWADFWKPKSPIQDLVRAGALITAEIDRLQRLELCSNNCTKLK